MQKVYSESSQRPEVQLFEKIVNGFQLSFHMDVSDNVVTGHDRTSCHLFTAEVDKFLRNKSIQMIWMQALACITFLRLKTWH